MAVLREKIAQRIKGTLQQTEDWWYLCYDTDTKEFFVEHKWDHVALNNLSQNADSETHDAETWNGMGADKISEAKAKLLAMAGH